MKLKNSNCGETQKLKLGWNSQTQIVMKLNTKIVIKKKMKSWWNLKTQIVMKLKTKDVIKLKISNLMKLKTQIVMKLKTHIVIKLKSSNWDETKKTQVVIKLKQIKWWQTSRRQIVTKLKNSNCETTDVMYSGQRFEFLQCLQHFFPASKKWVKNAQWVMLMIFFWTYHFKFFAWCSSWINMYICFILLVILEYEEEQSQGYNRRTMCSFTKFS